MRSLRLQPAATRSRVITMPSETVTIVSSATEPDVSVADAEVIIHEALAYLDEQRVSLREILTCIHEEGGAFGYALAQIVGPYVSRESCLALIKPSARQFWAGPARAT